MEPGQGTESKRRPTEEIRSLILEAARELFTAKGFDEVTTDEIAKRAGVLKPLIFTNFGSKAALFDASVVEPFADLVSGYIEAWRESTADSAPDDRVAGLAEGLFNFAREQRTVLLSALTQRAEGERRSADLLSHVASAIHEMNELGEIDAAMEEYPDLDAEAITAVFGAMVLGLALLDDMIFPVGGRRPSQERLTTEMTRTLLYGIRRPVR